MAAEDDGVGPDVADDVRGEVRRERRDEGLLDAREGLVHHVGNVAHRTLAALDAAQPAREARRLRLLDPPTGRDLGERKCAGADGRPADVVLDHLAARLHTDALDVVP